jgi:hypothetical protein
MQSSYLSEKRREVLGGNRNDEALGVSGGEMRVVMVMKSSHVERRLKSTEVLKIYKGEPMPPYHDGSKVYAHNKVTVG